MNSYQYRYRVEGGEWITFSSYTPPSASAQTIAADAARHYWNKHSPPEADMWPLPFELEGRGEFDIDVEARPEFVVRRKASVSREDAGAAHPDNCPCQKCFDVLGRY